MATVGNETRKYKQVTATSEDSDDENKELTNDIDKETQIKSRCCLILHPFGAFKIVWDVLVSIAVVLSAIEIPVCYLRL